MGTAPAIEEVADGLWSLDAPPVAIWRHPIPARGVLVRLDDGMLWLHAPVPADDALLDAVGALGELRHIVVPHPLFLPALAGWQARFPAATVALPRGLSAQVPGAQPLGDAAAPGWPGLAQLVVPGRRGLDEAAFFHGASSSLILHRMMMNIDTAPIPAWARPGVWLAGIDTTDGKMPPGLAAHLGGKARIIDAVEHLIGWRPWRILPTHGEVYPRDAVDELERAFRRLLRTRRWEAALRDAETRHRGGPGGGPGGGGG